MKHTDVVRELACCPQCKGELNELSKSVLSCSNCQNTYPELGHITWLFADPQHARAEWKNRFDYFLQMNQLEVQKLKLEQQAQELLETTKKRLSKLIQARVEHGRSIVKAIDPIIGQEDGDPGIFKAAGTKLPPTQALMSYYDNICRDWSYGNAENEICFRKIQNVLQGDEKLGTLAVLGSGACRLAYDIHRNCQVDRTLNVDINPFLFYVAQRMIQGKSLSLYEFPIAPSSLENFAVKLKCKAPEEIKNGFHFVFSDAMNPSFKDQAFDTLLTPWLIDIVHQDIKDQFKRYNRILKTGGRWINFGSLAFFHSNSAICYSLEETLEIAEDSGFEIQVHTHEEIPYLHSPYSCQKRFEKVLCFSARKIKDVPQPKSDFSIQPSWLENTKIPIPITPDLKQQLMVHQTLKSILELVDGEKSLSDIAQEATFLELGPEESLLIVKNVFSKYLDGKFQGNQF